MQPRKPGRPHKGWKKSVKKRYRQEFVDELLRVQKLPPEKTFDNIDEMMAYLNNKPLTRS